MPEELPCLECLLMEAISNGDIRHGLTPGVDKTVKTSQPIARGTILGPYRSLVVTPQEYEFIKDHPPLAFSQRSLTTAASRNPWRQSVESYAADVSQPHAASKAAEKFEDVFSNVMQVLVCICIVDDKKAARQQIVCLLVCYKQNLHDILLLHVTDAQIAKTTVHRASL